ncbi:MAG: amino acid adenylation domain-containing protein [Nibricoccus sp.]
MLTELERNKLLVEWNNTARDYPRHLCIHELFEQQSAAQPDRIAVVAGDERLTYAELDARSSRLADSLRARGVAADEPVGLCLERTAALVVGVLGILKAGGAYVPLDPAYPADRITYVLKDSRTRIIVTQRHLAATLPKTTAEALLLEELPSSATQPTVDKPATTSNNLAYIIYTSGSTGRPKGVAVPHRAVVNFLHSMQRQPGLNPDDTLLAVTTLSFDISGLELFLPLSRGAKIVIATRETAADGEALVRKIDQHGITVLQATPASWRLMLASGWKGTPSLRALCGGEALPSSLARELVPRTKELWNMYGPTETTIWSTCCRVTDPDDIHIGRPIDNTEAYILDENQQLLSIGHAGELYLGGAGLARGYWNQPDLTARSFILHPFREGERLYRTGDLARFRPDGTITCLGRLDHQVKLRGHRIELAEIEHQLALHPAIRQAVVVARGDAYDEKRLIAYFVPHNDTPMPMGELRAHLTRALPEFMIPSVFVPLASIPLTPSGKIDRNALPNPEAIPSLKTKEMVRPSNALQDKLVTIFKEVLGVPDVSVDESFFDLGGHSLLAVRLMSRVERETGRRLPLARLFEAPTVVTLAALLSDPNSDASEWNSLVPIKPVAGRPVLFMIHGGGGNVLLYREVAEALAPDISVYGLQSRGLDHRTAPLRTVEEMAELYIREIRLLKPVGPYHLAGYCMGGTIAYEMARQLHAQGRDVGLVALLDTFNLHLVDRSRSRFKNLSFLRQKIAFHLGTLLRLSLRDLRAYLREKFRMAVEASFEAVRQTWRSIFARKAQSLASTDTIMEINHDAGWKYIPKETQCTVTLYRPRKNYSFMADPQMGWGELAKGKLEIVELPVNPHAMLVSPYAKELALQLKEKISPNPLK